MPEKTGLSQFPRFRNSKKSVHFGWKNRSFYIFETNVSSALNQPNAAGESVYDPVWDDTDVI